MTFLERTKQLSQKVFRLVKIYGNHEPVGRLISLNFQLLEQVVVDNLIDALQTMTILEVIIEQSYSLYGLDESNILSILKEISEMNSEIRKSSSLAKNEDYTDENEEKDLNSEIRQLAILEKIKSFSDQGGCGLKELLIAFPDVSDRTLRYDLQKLSLQGSIVKIGNRGPNTVYRLK